MRTSARLVVVAMLVGCADPGDVELAEVELAERTVLPELLPGFVSAEPTDGRLVLVFTEDVALAPGDVVVGAAGGGYVRRILSVARDGGRLVAETEDATLVEAVRRGGFARTIDLAAELTPSGESLRSGGVRTVDLARTVITGGRHEGAPSRVAIERGTLALAPVVEVAGELAGGQLARFEAIADVGFDLELDVRAELRGDAGPFAGEVDVNGPEPLWTQPFVIDLGPVPVAGAFELDLVAEVAVEGHAEGQAAFGIRLAGGLRVGATWDDGAWRPVWIPELWAVARPVAFAMAGDASVAVTLRPVLRLRLYGRDVVAFEARPFARVDTRSAPDWWQLWGGMAGALELDAGDVLDGAVPHAEHTLDEWRALVDGR